MQRGRPIYFFYVARTKAITKEARQEVEKTRHDRNFDDFDEERLVNYPKTTPLACPDFLCVARHRYWYKSVCEKLPFAFAKGPGLGPATGKLGPCTGREPVGKQARQARQAGPSASVFFSLGGRPEGLQTLEFGMWRTQQSWHVYLCGWGWCRVRGEASKSLGQRELPSVCAPLPCPNEMPPGSFRCT